MTASQIDPQEIRDAFEKIAQRYRDGHEAIAPIRVSVVRDAQAHIQALEDHKASCTCQPVPTFDVTAHLRPRREHEVLSTTCARLKELGRTPPTVADILFDEAGPAAGQRECL